MKIHINKKYIPIISTLFVFILIYGISVALFPSFFSLQVFVNLFTDNAFLGIAAVGMTFVILSGGIDLSVSSMIPLAGVITATLVEKGGVHPLAAIAIVLCLGSALGIGMGAIIHFFNAPPFIVTLGGMFLARGIAQIISLESIPIYNPFFVDFVQFGIPLPGQIIFPVIAIIFLLVFFVGLYIAHFTRFGRNVYAIGGNLQSAMLMGLPVARTRILVYALNGLCAALSGVVYTMYTSAGYSLAGMGFELDVIAAVVIGGTLISGGVGLLAGTMVGVLIQGVIQTFITFQGTLSSWWTRIFIGFLLFIFIMLQRYISRLPVSKNATESKESTEKPLPQITTEPARES